MSNCKCCGSEIGKTKAGIHRAVVSSDVLKDIGEALIAYAAIESVDLITGKVVLSVDVEDDQQYYTRLSDIRNELNSYYAQPTIEWLEESNVC